MGGTTSSQEKGRKQREPRRGAHDLEYYEMNQARGKRDAQKHKALAELDGAALA